MVGKSEVSEEPEKGVRFTIFGFRFRRLDLREKDQIFL